MPPSSLSVGIYERQSLMLGTGLSGSFTQHLRHAQLKTVFRFTHDKTRTCLLSTSMGNNSCTPRRLMSRLATKSTNEVGEIPWLKEGRESGS